MQKSKYKYPLVMLIDDNHIDIFIHKKVMEHCCFAKRVIECTTGVRALQYFHDLNQENSDFRESIPSLIFSNINMPLMDGIEFIKEFKQLSEAYPDTKIVIVTASINPLEKNEAMKHNNVLTFIQKPLNFTALKTIHSLYKKSNLAFK